MSSWRGFFATLSALSLFHLILLSGGGGCLMPSRAASAAHAAGSGSAAAGAADASASVPLGRGHHAHAVGSTAANEQPAEEGGARDEHGGARICTSLAPCSIAVAPAAASVAQAPAPAASEQLDWSPRELRSIAFAPELPPPRA